jgi:hypothetical protein
MRFEPVFDRFWQNDFFFKTSWNSVRGFEIGPKIPKK